MIHMKYHEIFSTKTEKKKKKILKQSSVSVVIGSSWASTQSH